MADTIGDIVKSRFRTFIEDFALPVDDCDESLGEASQAQLMVSFEDCYVDF
jgi:hypothetical protein